jgi:hypothetical protein
LRVFNAIYFLSVRGSTSKELKSVPEKPKNKPKVIVFFTDQQRWDTTGVHGNPLDLTPNFDRMARSGTMHLSETLLLSKQPTRQNLDHYSRSNFWGEDHIWEKMRLTSFDLIRLNRVEI